MQGFIATLVAPCFLVYQEKDFLSA